MPVDNTNKVKSKRLSQNSQQQTLGAMAAGRYDSDTESVLPTEWRRDKKEDKRTKLHNLFGQIEKEFETLYAENLALHEKLEHFEGGNSGEKQTDSLEATDGNVKSKRSASHISQKIKKSYIASTTKLVSSFRQASPNYSIVKSFRGHKDGVWEVNISKLDNQIIGTASADHTSRIWNVETGHCLLQYTGHQGSVNSIRFNPVKDLVVTCSGEGTAHIWCPSVNCPPHEIMRSHSSGEDDLDMSEKEDMADDGEQMMCATLRTPSRELIGHVSVVIAADWMFNGDQVITASWDRTAILFDAETGETISTLTGHDQELTEVKAHNTQNMVLTCSKDTTFRLWDFRDPNMPVTVFQGHTQPVTSAVFAAAEKIVSGSDDRTVKVWDLKYMRAPLSTIRTDSAINKLAVLQSQGLIAIPHDNRHIRLYDINGNRYGRLPRSNRTGHSKMVCSVAWSEDNPVCNLLSCGFDRQVLGWHINLQNKE